MNQLYRESLTDSSSSTINMDIFLTMKVVYVFTSGSIHEMVVPLPGSDFTWILPLWF